MTASDWYTFTLLGSIAMIATLITIYDVCKALKGEDDD